MKRNFATLALFSLMTLCFSGLFAQSVSNTGSGVSDNSTAEEVLQRNIGEVSQFRGYTDGFQNAIKAGNVQLAQGHQVKLVGAMEREILQAEAKGLNAESDKGLKSQKAILDQFKAFAISTSNLSSIQAKMSILDDFEQVMKMDLPAAKTE